MKKITKKVLVGIATISCFVITVFAMYGSVISDSAIDGTVHDQYVNINGIGRAEEVVAVPEEIMNIYAKTVIADPQDYILAQNNLTDHYVRRVYAKCSTRVNDANLLVGDYYVSTLAAARYIDNTTTNDVSVATEQYLWDVRSATMDKSADAEYSHVSLRELCDDGMTARSVAPKQVLVDIYSQHFIKAGVGDKVPQVYLKNDGSMCYVVDENRTNGETKTYYEIDGNTFNKVS